MLQDLKATNVPKQLRVTGMMLSWDKTLQYSSESTH